MNFGFPLQWMAEQYSCVDLNWYISVGAPPPPDNFDGIVLQDIDAAAGTFLYYTSFVWNLKNVDLGFRCKLVQQNTRLFERGYLAVDGVDQNGAPDFIPTNADWISVPLFTGNWSPKAGAILFADFNGYTAVGY